ncbi:hypothetical protein LCGC14_0827280 [marine sediment metagenome]|uniref:Uncharacterized protein n=1 Tax=marine sediment metagenome TaxID=412755 RepID=A0A0F9PH02_9ZZZZ
MQSTITLLVVGTIIITLLYIGLHTDLVEDVSNRKTKKRKRED